MELKEETLTITYNDQILLVNIMESGLGMIYKVNFTDRPALCVTHALNRQGYPFWTSIPEGRQKLAEEVGLLIENKLS